jgi:hypothetical protein
MPLGLKQPADLAVASLGQLDQQMGFPLRTLPHRHRSRPKVADPHFHAPRRLIGDEAACGDDVAADDGGGGRRQPVCKLWVGGQQQKAGARLVEPSHCDE